MKKGDKVKEITTDIIWTINDCKDIHNIELSTEEGIGTWIACFSPNCSHTDLGEVEILNTDKKPSEAR